MSNRSYPADFSRHLREAPIANEAEIQAMLARLRRRCDQVSLKPSAATPTAAASSVVSGGAAITATAGGGSNGIEHGLSLPFQPTRPAPDIASGPAGQEAGEVRGVHPAVKTPSLQWERINPTAMRTTCGIWTCCKVMVMGKTQYELFRRIAGLERPARVLDPFASFEHAKQAAQNEMDRVD